MRMSSCLLTFGEVVLTLVSPDYTQEQIINQIDFVTQDSVSRSIGEFYWFFGKDWFIETHLGNFHW